MSAKHGAIRFSCVLSFSAKRKPRVLLLHIPLLAGIDVGSTNIKALIYDSRGGIHAHASCKTPTHFPRPGWAYYDPEEMWQTTASTLRAAVGQVDRPQQIVSVAVASIGETGVLLDAAGAPLYEAIAWYDARSQPQAEELAGRLGADRVYRTTGIAPQSIFSLSKLLWIQQNEPDLFARAVHWLHMADFIAWRLCGEMATDRSLASRTMALDLRRLAWATGLIEDAGLPPLLFAPLRQSGELLGRVHGEGAATSGLPAGTVVGVGGHDHLCGALAVGAVSPAVMLDSIGTAEAILLLFEEPFASDDAAAQGYEQGAHVAGGYYGAGAFRTSGACVDWFRQTMGGGADYATLTAEAAETPVGAMGVRFLPHLRLPHAPSNDPCSRGLFLGLSTDVTRGALFRSVLEGIALEGRNVLAPMLDFVGVEIPQTVIAIGGMSRNALFMQIKANVFNRAVVVPHLEEETAAGAALLGGIAAGVYPDVGAAARAFPTEKTLYRPVPEEVARYDTIFRQVYSSLYAAVRDLNHANCALTGS